MAIQTLAPAILLALFGCAAQPGPAAGHPVPEPFRRSFHALGQADPVNLQVDDGGACVWTIHECDVVPDVGGLCHIAAIDDGGYAIWVREQVFQVVLEDGGWYADGAGWESTTSPTHFRPGRECHLCSDPEQHFDCDATDGG